MLAMRLDLSARRVRRMLGALARRARDLEPVRRDFAEYLVGSVKRNFEAGGRPRPWPPSARARRHGDKTLINTGRLRASISWRVRGNAVLVGTNLAYAPAHQFGVRKRITQRVRAHARRTRTGRVVAVRAHTRRIHMRLPPRPFLVVQAEDWAYLRRRLRRHLRPKEA